MSSFTTSSWSWSPIALMTVSMLRPVATTECPAPRAVLANSTPMPPSRARSPSLSQLLADRSKKDFVDVNVVRLAHREHHHAGEGVGRERDLHGFADARGDIRFGDTVGEVRGERAG